MRTSIIFPLLTNDSRQGLLLSASPAPLPRDHGSVPVTHIMAFLSAVPSGLLRLGGGDDRDGRLSLESRSDFQSCPLLCTAECIRVNLGPCGPVVDLESKYPKSLP